MCFILEISPVMRIVRVRQAKKSLFHAADEAFPTARHKTGRFYLVGESLGTGVAAYLAGTHPDQVVGVVLFLRPYNRLADAAPVSFTQILSGASAAR